MKHEQDLPFAQRPPDQGIFFTTKYYPGDELLVMHEVRKGNEVTLKYGDVTIVGSVEDIQDMQSISRYVVRVTGFDNYVDSEYGGIKVDDVVPVDRSNIFGCSQ